jgi:hypothetical protein
MPELDELKQDAIFDRREEREFIERNNEMRRRWDACEFALKIAEINRTAEVQKILADAKRILSFYEKGPVE